MAATKLGRFVMEMFISGMKLHILGFWSMAFSNFKGKICSDHDFTLNVHLNTKLINYS